MAQDARATTTGGGALLKAAALALAGLTALAVLVQPGADRPSCPAPACAALEQRPGPIEPPLVPDQVLRDMRLHD